MLRLVLLTLSALIATRVPAELVPGPTLPEWPSDDPSAMLAATQGTEPEGMIVDAHNRAAVVAFYNDVFLPAFNTPITWTGNPTSCTAGDIPQAYKQATMDMVNYFRAMVGLPANVFHDPVLDAACQDAALMFMANNALSHTPPTGWLCFTTAGKDAALRSNISRGHSGPVAIANGYIPENGDGNKNGSHRRWILWPRQVKMGIGAAFKADHTPSATNAMYVLSSAGPRPLDPEMVAWPPPGFVPFKVAYERWSFSVNIAPNRVNLSQASVQVFQDDLAVPLTLHEPVEDVLADDTILWDIDPQAFGSGMKDRTFHVLISDFIIDGTARDYEYSITVIDPNQTPPVEPDALRDFMLGSNSNPAGLDVNGDSVVDVADLISSFAQ